MKNNKKTRMRHFYYTQLKFQEFDIGLKAYQVTLT